MKKLALALEDLAVESFGIAAEGYHPERGTVHGRSGPVEPNDSEAQCDTSTNTDGPTCGAENTCGYYYDTCMYTWIDPTCDMGYCGSDGCQTSPYVC
jgi:hypothetical protein